MLRFGKKPARPGAIKLEFRKYANLSALPTPPSNFGHGKLVTSGWGMLGNDQYGDCVWAGAAHETLLWNYEAGVGVPFTDQAVLSDYSAVTGFNPNDPNTDQGTDMQAAAAYRQKTGIVDSTGKRHTVGAYLAIQPGNLEEHMTAAFLFGTVGIGITCPSNIIDQFNAGDPWAVTAGTSIDGGHYIPFIDRDGGLTVICTWGREQAMEDDWFAANNDESVVYLSSEFLSGGKSLDGFDLQQLQSDLSQLQGG